MSSQAPLLSGTIEADEDVPVTQTGKFGQIKPTRAPELLVPGTQAGRGGNSGTVEEGGIVSCYAGARHGTISSRDIRWSTRGSIRALMKGGHLETVQSSHESGILVPLQISRHRGICPVRALYVVFKLSWASADGSHRQLRPQRELGQDVWRTQLTFRS